MEEKNGVKVEIQSKNRAKKIILIAVLICIVIGVIDILNNSFVDEEKVYNYQQQISEYLQDKYEEEFNIEFLKKGYKKRIFDSGDGAVAYYGRDRDITEYMYKFSPKDNTDITCYIAYWYEKDTGNTEISEISDREYVSISNGEVATYGVTRRFYHQKLQIKDMIESYFKDEEYTLDLYSNIKEITATTDKKIEDIVLGDTSKLTNLYNNIFNLLDYTRGDVSIILYYKDCKIKFSASDYHIHFEYLFEREWFESVDEMMLYIKSL